MTADKPQIILASASPRRERLLRELGLRFIVVCPDGIEELDGGAAPDVVAMQNAQRKARAVAGRHPHSMVIGADTIVVLDGRIFGKPRNREDGRLSRASLARYGIGLRRHHPRVDAQTGTRADRRVPQQD